MKYTTTKESYIGNLEKPKKNVLANAALGFGLGALAISSIVYTGLREPKQDIQNTEGFQNGFKVTHIYAPVRGIVKGVEMMPEEKYDSTLLESGDTWYSGVFRFTLFDEGKKKDMSDDTTVIIDKRGSVVGRTSIDDRLKE
ncbi:MAG: hypothetical protein ACP5NW_00815 [Candidatus Woesearchaeota archaeon]